MYVRVIPNNKGKKNTYFCDLVESYRNENGDPRQRVVVKLGQFEAEYIPYLKAAFAKDSDPAEVFSREAGKYSKSR